ncbi:hypothetical protein [Tritonibacter scottomollicae]|uniref:Uncharacterized protein n=1 Tax=Tritonibacter scottomollicae TaxID=483013 RepID=A0A2T1AIK1_TRISK|nr:hypothetical protein [Tritonibacter scottomollicae]PRZ48429.1 hypothetical protein CLV89_104257 [Tritonibacter scottomollicae]
MHFILRSAALVLALGAGARALAQDTSGMVAEPQTITGKFLTATEVKPVLSATQGNWVSVREFNGQDLVYVTHLWAWRCGLAQMEVALNDAAYEIWQMPDCYTEGGSPGAIKSGDGEPYRAFELGSVERIKVRLVYDDLSTDEAEFQRADIIMQ